jgi:hypothetical protein
VAAGAIAYRTVLDAPTALSSYAGRPGTQLLPVAERAFRTSTRGDWQHQPAVSTRTGANVAAWGDSWLHPHMGTTTTTGVFAPPGSAPQAYMIALRHVALTLDSDPAWRWWWRQSGLRACELGIVAEGKLDHLRPSADIRRCEDRLRANFTCALADDDTDLATRAAAEVRAMFEVIRQAMSMPALPPTPPVPALPTDVPDVPVTTKALPSVPQELEPQGYLTLAQIQEFFG